MNALIAFLPLLMSQPSEAKAPIVNEMTCQQTRAYSECHGRVYLRTRYGDIIPIYGYDRDCANHEIEVPYWVPTKDKKTCLIGHRCTGAT